MYINEVSWNKYNIFLAYCTIHVKNYICIFFTYYDIRWPKMITIC